MTIIAQDRLPTMPIPEITLQRAVRLLSSFCDERVPPKLRNSVRLVLDLDESTVTIVEERPPFRGRHGEGWTRRGMVRFRYRTVQRVWTLYWNDRHGRWHVYHEIAASEDIAVLLRHVVEDPTAIFWG